MLSLGPMILPAVGSLKPACHHRFTARKAHVVQAWNCLAKSPTLAPALINKCVGPPLHGKRSGVHNGKMATYTIIPRPDQSGFDIAIIGADGARQTMLGFKTTGDAKAWIVQDERLNEPRPSQERFA